MAVCYDRLFHKLIDDRMSTSELREKAGVSANIISRIRKNEYVSLESIESICNALSCSVDGILEFVSDENNTK